MTEKVFWSDPYLTELNTCVQSVQGSEITLEKTIFYALSGGQESDEGTIGNFPVLQAKKNGKEIFYTLPQEHNLSPGNEVFIKIDWKRRYKLMRLHFAAEIVLELMYQQFPGIEKIGAHIAADKARIDFNWAENLTSHLTLLTDKANAIVKNNLPITSAFSDIANERRYWEITGYFKVPCGGTHLKNTNEIGIILLKRDNIGKGKQRINIYATE